MTNFSIAACFRELPELSHYSINIGLNLAEMRPGESVSIPPRLEDVLKVRAMQALAVSIDRQNVGDRSLMSVDFKKWWEKRSPTIESKILCANIMQIVLPPEVEALVQRQLISGKYNSAIEVILAGVKLLEQQQDIYQGRLQELQQDALEEAYRQASQEIDPTWDVTIADGLTNETW
ncbi:type II toxin-antitoxin system ParD family antitoxin [Trichocoleus sp. DQ-A2]|nr:type II toxin-antitoxin system ParD family antitoxin [Coleofasciculus sp. FACHB-T130]